MGLKKMVEDVQQSADVFAISSGLSGPNIVDNHVSDPLSSMLLSKEIGGQCRGNHVRYVLVLRDGEHFGLAETAARDTIFERNHEFHPGRRIDW